MHHLPALAALILSAACTPAPAPEPAPEPAPGALLSGANPASVFCEEQGGTLDIRDEPGGQVGYCTLPDGRVVEEWTLWREANP
ncbi:DUF333 domain-containing protein [Aliigemmobacter aestuarii]|uniref:DUF333 domain-containing protein n=1 Tax=Aliigemmobacter aestuarii TaxID=1445661 RepID=A0A4S3MPM4_9RHOB|nr:DUF333 domain-containing protein [Gemmobacter aestuarii]THD84388.1 DUF333 domain-containing protein [Gemmobacter aestuarii]